MWPLDGHYGILLGSSVCQLFFDPLYYHSAQLYLNEPTFRVVQVVSAVGYNSIGVERPSPLPEGSNRSQAELDTPELHATCRGGIPPRNPCVAYAIGDIKYCGKLCLVAPSYQKQSRKTIRSNPEKQSGTIQKNNQEQSRKTIRNNPEKQYLQISIHSN
ncbi:hypothetical protein NPIL_520371 [Nephila pilipes]|uniref:Uncharacterized protein n=1 Tax=Nephila pilipes TaxID=299642 RepID=A0A8X6TEP5_NEPPI|nr:hypothetical protein NPIL_520371 [Nephila pilipes]